jgi:hypothetical protein
MLVERSIAGAPRRDAQGPYPLFACARWSALGSDLEALADELVSVTLVTDPFGDWSPELLRDCFPDVARPFKEHLVADLARPVAEIASPHHRRDARAAARRVQVHACDGDPRWVTEWCRLYAHLVQHHGITGAAAFPARSLAAQLSVPGARLLRAEHGGNVVAMSVWYRRDDVAVYHLAASSELGYEVGASYALMHEALEAFRAEGARWAHLGAGAGVRPGGAADGLTRFKQGWATGTRPAWLCGRVLDREAYDRLSQESAGGWFPAYRAGELA